MNHMCMECTRNIKTPQKTIHSAITTYDLYVVPEWKFILYSVASFWLFYLFWFYRLWKYVKFHNSIDISPFWRAFFWGWFVGPLAARIRDLLLEKGVKSNIWPVFIGITFIFLNLTGRYPGLVWMLAYFSFLPLLPMVSGVRTYARSEWKLAMSEMVWWEIILVIIWLILFALSVSIDLWDIR